MPRLLTAVGGPALGMCWELTGSHVLGREGDIAVDDAALSRTHLRLRARGHTVRCADAGSSNGSHLRKGRIRRRIGAAWIPLRRGAVLELGAGAYRLAGQPGPFRERRWGPDTLARMLVPLAMAAALVPFALGGPPWRWVMVVAPLAAVALLARSRESEILRSSHPAHVLLASGEGRAFHAEPVVPRELRVLRRPLGGTGWCVLGPRAEQQATWLAGFLAVHNDPDVLRVTSPWLTTLGAGLEVRFEERGSGPATGQAMVTWAKDRPPQWAIVLRPPAWAAAGTAWARSLQAGGPAARPPLAVHASVLPAAEVRRHWDRPRADLAVPLGESQDGPFVVDLVRVGPHALVAGMSGAGKSELLTTWLLELAQRNPPSLLQFILVDFKGGAAFNHLAPLPHCVGVLTDLDEGATRRALASLRAQLRRRKELVAAARCRDVTEYNARDGRSLPLLVVVIDEFRALALDHPELLEQFLHLAHQGRSLGVHLVAATQRPAGAVSPELRANMPLRLCLRVAEAADSLDVVAVPDAARLEPVPGRALVRGESLTRIQVSWSGDGTSVANRVAGLVAQWDGPPAAPPWCPPLPRVLPASLVRPGDIGLADEPDLLRQRPVALPDALLILGNPGSGRSTAAATVAAAALAQGDEVWLVTAQALPWTGRGAFGGILHPRETRLVGNLLRHLAHTDDRRRTLVFDDLELWVDAHDALHGEGTATGELAAFVRAARSGGTRVVAVTPPGMVHARWAAPLTRHLHLAGLDTATAMACGVPRTVAPDVCGPVAPGRGLLMPDGLLMQLARWDDPPPVPPGRAVRFVPLPARGEARPLPGRIVLGATSSGELSIEAAGDVVVVGPPGSGRSMTARLIHQQHPGSVFQDGEHEDVARPIVATATPGDLSASWSGVLARLRAAGTVLLLRPDLHPRLPGLDYAAELEPGSPGYAVLVHRGRASALRLATALASVVEEVVPAPAGEELPCARGRQRDQGGGGQSHHEGCEPTEHGSQCDHREDHEEMGGHEHPAGPGASFQERQRRGDQEGGHDDVVQVRPDAWAGGVPDDQVPDRDRREDHGHGDRDRGGQDHRAGTRSGHGASLVSERTPPRWPEDSSQV
ncbi:MAG: FtsK/SpoIIIE domain-containing protein [Actinomycetota bacterium]